MENLGLQPFERNLFEVDLTINRVKFLLELFLFLLVCFVPDGLNLSKCLLGQPIEFVGNGLNQTTLGFNDLDELSADEAVYDAASQFVAPLLQLFFVFFPIRFGLPLPASELGEWARRRGSAAARC